MVVQNNGKGKTKKRAHVQICFLLIRRKSVLHVRFVFLLIRSISLEPIFIVVPRLALHDLFSFRLHVLLTRASLLAVAKSIYYRLFRQVIGRWLSLLNSPGLGIRVVLPSENNKGN